MLLGATLMFVLGRGPSQVGSPAFGAWAPAAEPTRAGATGIEAAPAAASAVHGLSAADDASATAQPAAPKASAVEAVQRAAQQAAERRDRAWARFYQKPAQCDENPTKATMVECANHYIRARREFEAQYGPARP